MNDRVANLAKGLFAGICGITLVAVLLESTARLVEDLPVFERAARGRIDAEQPHFPLLNLVAPGLVTRDDGLGYRLRAGATVIQADADVQYHINAQGFRGDEVQTAKPAETYRIITTGGSTTFGWGVGDDQTYPVALAAVLRARCEHALGDHIEVINGGVPGYTSTQNARRLEREWNAYDPDMVIVMEGLNDLATVPTRDVSAGEAGRWDTIVASPARALLLKWYSAAIAHSAFARVFDRALWRARLVASPVEDPPTDGPMAALSAQIAALPPEALRRFATIMAQSAKRSAAEPSSEVRLPLDVLRVLDDNLLAMRRLAQSRGFSLVVLRPPTLRDDYMSRLMEQLPEAFRPRARLSLHPKEFDIVAGFVADWASTQNLPAVDLEGAFRRSGHVEELYLDDGMHLTKKGNELIAEEIYERQFKARCESSVD